MAYTETSIQKTTTESSPNVDVIIIGAGLSGLTSALKILEKEHSLQVRILEASHKIGGQIIHTRLGELGGKWITEDQYHIYSLLKELNVPIRRRTILASHNERCWDIDEGIFSFFIKHELFRYIDELDLSCQYFRPEQQNSYEKRGSMRCHINKRLISSRAKKFMSNLVELFSGVDATDISYNEFMTLCCSCGGLKTLMDLYINLPETLWEFSSSRLLKELQDKLTNVEILFKRKVEEIRHLKDSIEICDSEKVVHRAEVVILAVPRNSVAEIRILPTIPMELRKPVPPPIDRSKHVMTSFIAQYLEGHWRFAGYNGSLLLSEPFFIIGYEYRPTVYSGIVIHDEGIEPLIRQIALHALAEKFGEEMLLPIDYVQRTFEMSSITNMPFTSPWSRVVWSSSSTAATCYRGRLGGAVQSGLRAAMNVLFTLRPQTVSWQDIAEIQRSGTTISPSATRISIWLSSWNIFNCSYYSICILGFATTLRFLYKNYFI